jgi:hypothetical protein
MRQNARDRIVDGAAEAAALRGDVDKWDRPLIEAGMLIHRQVFFSSRSFSLASPFPCQVFCFAKSFASPSLSVRQFFVDA